MEGRNRATYWKLGCAHPMGPLELMTLSGWIRLCIYWRNMDVRGSLRNSRNYAVVDPLLKRMVKAGYLAQVGRRGFYDDEKKK